MKLKCQAAELMSALRTVQSVVDARPIRPIYECVRIDADDSSITVTGGNSEQQITARVEAEVKEGGAVAVPLKVISGYVSAITDTVDIVSDKHGGIVIKSGSLKAVIAGQDVDDYKVLSLEFDPLFTANAYAFANAISSITFAINSDTSAVKRILCCAHVEVDGGGHGTIVGISDRKLGKYCFSANMLAEHPVSVNIPSSVIKSLCSVLQGQETLSCTIQNHVVMVEAGTKKFIFPEVAGTYVEWERVLTNVKQDKFARAKIKSLSDAIRFSGVSGKNGETFLALLHFDNDAQKMTISSRGVISDSKAEVPIDYTGDSIDIAFDVRVLQDAVTFCASTGAEDVEISMSLPTFTASVRPIGSSDECIAAIAPVRTQPSGYSQNA